MGELKNSQRISYKATYVQTKPSPADAQPAAQAPKRALEKASFVASLKVRDFELKAIVSELSPGPATETSKQLLHVAQVVQELIADISPMAVVDRASSFATLSSDALVGFADRILAVRGKALAEATRLLGAIELARETLPTPAPPPSDTANPTTTSNERRVEVATRNVAGTRLRLTRAGTRRPARRTATASARAIVGNHVSVESEHPAEGLPTASSRTATVDPVTSSSKLSQALRWAQAEKSDQFIKLSDIVVPYTTNDRTALLPKDLYAGIVDGTAQLQRMVRDGGASSKAFQDRMKVEPVGRLHLERVEMYPAGIERGELVHSVPLSPKETVNLSHREWSLREEEFLDIVKDSFEGFSEEGVAEKNDLSQANESQSKHASALNVGASLSASYASVTLSTSFGYNMTSEDQEAKKDSRNHSMNITKKAAARTKKEHKFSFRVASVAGSEDQAIRTITNPNDKLAMRVDYFQLVRKWKLDLLRYGLRMTYDIVVPNPGAALVTKLQQLEELNKLIDEPFSFDLPLDAIKYNSQASSADLISNWDKLAAQYDAVVTPPPQAKKTVSVHKELLEDIQGKDNVHFDFIQFDIDDNYFVEKIEYDYEIQTDDGDTDAYLDLMNDDQSQWGPEKLIGKSGSQTINFVFQGVWTYAINIIFHLRPKVEMLKAWRLEAWNQLRQGAEEQYVKSRQVYKDQRTKLIEEVGGYDALTLRRMEQEEIMKGVLRWLLGPSFQLVPADVASLFRLSDSNDPDVKNVLDPNQLDDAAWARVMERGEFIKYVQNAIEWENILYFTYPYFWDDNANWEFKKFLFHPDPRHRTFLRAGAARVVLTIRPGFEDSFASLVDSGSLSGLPGGHPYVTIAQEIQNFAKTNYPGFPPANAENNSRPLLFPQQRKAWEYMQTLMVRLEEFKATSLTQSYPTTADGLAALPGEAIAKDPWGRDYFYESPGVTGDYDLICHGRDGKVGGEGLDADISATAEASLIATWFEYSPTSALDIGITTHLTEMA